MSTFEKTPVGESRMKKVEKPKTGFKNKSVNLPQYI